MNKKYHNSTNDTEEMQCHFEAGMLNHYSVYSASNVRRLCSLLCPAISFLHFHVLHFHVRHFHVQHFQRPRWGDRLQKKAKAPSFQIGLG